MLAVRSFPRVMRALVASLAFFALASVDAAPTAAEPHSDAVARLDLSPEVIRDAARVGVAAPDVAEDPTREDAPAGAGSRALSTSTVSPPPCNGIALLAGIVATQVACAKTNCPGSNASAPGGNTEWPRLRVDPPPSPTCTVRGTKLF